MAIVLRQIDAEIVNLEYEFMTPSKLMVRGEITKQITYVSNAEVVRHQNAVVPFTVTLEVIGFSPEMDLTVTAEIEHISPRLIQNGTQVEQQIIIKVTVSPATGGFTVTRQFLIRSVETLEESQPMLKTFDQNSEPALLPELDSPGDFPEENPEISPLPDIELLLEEKLGELEQELRQELESSLRAELRAELESSLRSELRTQMETELQERVQEELRQRAEAERQAELQRQKEQQRYFNDLQRRSAMQNLFGFKVKG